jgi:hypothetical protein
MVMPLACAQRVNVLAPAWRIEIDDAVRTKRRDDTTAPAGCAHRAVMFQRIARGVGRRKNFDIESLEERARTKRWRREFRGDFVVNLLRGLGGELPRDAKDDAQFVRQPDAGRCAAKEIKIVRERLPDFAMIALDRATIHARHAECFERNALRVQHPKNIVIGNDEQIGRRTERIVWIGKHSRIHVTVRTNQRQVFDVRVQLHRNFFLPRVGTEIAIVGQGDV